MRAHTLLILPLVIVAFLSNPAAGEEATPKPSQEELEEKFKQTLTNATMKGRWCLIKEDGELTSEKVDQYDIVSVTKTKDTHWIIQSRIRYNKFDFVLPVPVQVVWAEDTPVIIVDKMGIPGGGTYSARVVVYDDSYAGTWSGPNVRGLLNGAITKTPKEEEKNEGASEESEEPSSTAEKEGSKS